jgi:hypothetical protein
VAGTPDRAEPGRAFELAPRERYLGAAFEAATVIPTIGGRIPLEEVDGAMDPNFWCAFEDREGMVIDVTRTTFGGGAIRASRTHKHCEIRPGSLL